ncbi:hypothetical protein BYT27DRAFT_7259194 [Phlegmacium glaucopus]|nr:hypothetical protein BYT27DRAFT_7259194 [Phlegmacium glaucopus]
MSPTTAEWSEYASPLPHPPPLETMNPIIHETITNNPDLFQIITPINVDRFEQLLVNHPNQPFVHSVCQGLREGFWPWADTLSDDFPLTHDKSHPPPADLKRSSFIQSQCEIEVKKNRFSKPFGPDLLPGMYSMPVYTVDKPNSTNLCLVTNHSAGRFALNNMIDHTCITGNVPVTMWKSDISEAYCLLPIHPVWQIKQVNTVNGLCYVNRNLAFGSSASPGIFISFNSLIAWIAKYVKFFDYLANYVDDSSGCNLIHNTLLYDPYQRQLPSHQKQLLDLWDELGIPHKLHKQVLGCPLTIIGIDVDPNTMTLSLPDSARTQLIEELTFWASKPTKPSSGSFKLKHWERLTGWFNWALNIYPHLRLALNNVYSKIGGKRNREQQIYINNAIQDDFLWAIHHIEASDGVHLLKSMHWDPSIANFTIFCDACPEGLGFWYPSNKTGYYAPTPVNVPTEFIFYYKSLCVLSALTNLQKKAHRGSWIIIYTDNSNTERAIAIGHAIDTTTLKLYNSALNSYLSFVRIHEMPVDPTPETLSFFTVYMCHHINPKSVASYLSGIAQQLEPFFPEVRRSQCSSLVERTLRGCMRLKGIATNRKQALTTEDLSLVPP